MKANRLQIAIFTLFLLIAGCLASECSNLQNQATASVCSSGCSYQQAESGGCNCDLNTLNRYLNAIRTGNCGQFFGSAEAACNQVSQAYHTVGCTW
jgi:hypothetical protein